MSREQYVTMEDLALSQAEFRKVAGNPNFAAMFGGRRPSELDDDSKAIVVKWHKEYALALMMESAELMDWSPWKHWSKRLGNKQDIVQFSDRHRDEVLNELADIVCFLMNMCALWGIETQQLMRAVQLKTEVNHKRQASGTY